MLRRRRDAEKKKWRRRYDVEEKKMEELEGNVRNSVER